MFYKKAYMIEGNSNGHLPDAHIVLDRFINDVTNTFSRLRALIDEQETIVQAELDRLTGGSIDLKSRLSDRSYNILTKVDGYHTFLEQVRKSLNDLKHPANLDTMCFIANENGLVPVQILNARSYVYRRLNDACKKGEMLYVQSETDGKRYYYLPEWRMKPSEALKEIGKLKEKA